MPKILDGKLIKQIVGDAEVEHLEHLDASNKEIEAISPSKRLKTLRRLDISNNKISDVTGLAKSTSISWLNLSANRVSDLRPLEGLKSLKVLNVAHNALSGNLVVPDVPGLNALIANSNSLTGLKSLGPGTALNTLVLKDNQISQLGSALSPCTSLAKLSIAHNQLTDLGASLEHCHHLAELRLSHNLLTSLPVALAQNTRLKILELGGNPLSSLASIKVLKKLPHLASLTLKGCPVSKEEGYQEKVRRMLPYLRTLDNRRLQAAPKRPTPDSARGAELGANAAHTKKARGSPESPVVALGKGSQVATAERPGADVEPNGAQEAEKTEERRKKKRKGSAEDIKAGREKARKLRRRSLSGVGEQAQVEEPSLQNQPEKRKKKKSVEQRTVEVEQEPMPAFLQEVISGRLEADSAPGAKDEDEEEVGPQKSKAKSKRNCQTSLHIVLQPGMRGVEVAKALIQGGLLSEADAVGTVGASTWD